MFPSYDLATNKMAISVQRHLQKNITWKSETVRKMWQEETKMKKKWSCIFIYLFTAKTRYSSIQRLEQTIALQSQPLFNAFKRENGHKWLLRFTVDSRFSWLLSPFWSIYSQMCPAKPSISHLYETSLINIPSTPFHYTTSKGNSYLFKASAWIKHCGSWRVLNHLRPEYAHVNMTNTWWRKNTIKMV